MKPYYHNGTTRIYQGDCLDVLAQLDQKVDLVVTSPPFNCNMEYEIGLWETLDQYLGWLCSRFVALWDVCASGAWVAVELQDMHVSPEHSHAHKGQKEQFNMATGAHLTVAMIEQGFYYKGEAVWDRGRWVNNMAGRMACAPGSPALLVQHSKVLFFRKPGGRKGVYEHPEQSKKWKARWCRTVWTHVQPEYNKDHPAVMPYSMAFGLIRGWSVPGHTVLDLFAGTGTVLRAAKDAGRLGIGIEILPSYCKLAAQRVQQEVLFALPIS